MKLKEDLRSTYRWRLLDVHGNFYNEGDHINGVNIDPNNPPTKIQRIDLQPYKPGYPEVFMKIPERALPVFFFKVREEPIGNVVNMFFNIGYSIDGIRHLLAVDCNRKNVTSVIR